MKGNSIATQLYISMHDAESESTGKLHHVTVYKFHPKAREQYFHQVPFVFIVQENGAQHRKRDDLLANSFTSDVSLIK